MRSAKELEIALHYLQCECNRAGYGEAGFFVELARMSLEDAKRARRQEEQSKSNVIRLRA